MTSKNIVYDIALVNLQTGIPSSRPSLYLCLYDVIPLSLLYALMYTIESDTPEKKISGYLDYRFHIETRNKNYTNLCWVKLLTKVFFSGNLIKICKSHLNICVYSYFYDKPNSKRNCSVLYFFVYYSWTYKHIFK